MSEFERACWLGLPLPQYPWPNAPLPVPEGFKTLEELTVDPDDLLVLADWVEQRGGPGKVLRDAAEQMRAIPAMRLRLAEIMHGQPNVRDFAEKHVHRLRRDAASLELATPMPLDSFVGPTSISARRDPWIRRSMVDIGFRVSLADNMPPEMIVNTIIQQATEGLAQKVATLLAGKSLLNPNYT